jgi:hypothetical protein
MTRQPREQKATRKFNGHIFHLADWSPTKRGARATANKWVKSGVAVNVRVVKMKYGYNVYVRT